MTRVRALSVVMLLAVSALAQSGHNQPVAGSKVALSAVSSPPVCLGPLVTPGAPATATSCASLALQSEKAPRRSPPLPHLERLALPMGNSPQLSRILL